MTSLLAVYDFCSQPPSVGDVIVFSQGTVVLAETLGLNRIDFCLVYDKEVLHVDPHFHPMLESGSHLHYVFKFGSLFSFNPYLGAIHVLPSYKELDQFLAKWPTPEVIWPSLEQINNRFYLNYEVHQLVSDFYKKYDRLPHLPIPEPHKSWCQKLIDQYKRFPVSVNLRNNPNRDPIRNSNMDEWITFFNRASDLPVQFFVICDFSEVDVRLLSMKNVTVMKSLGSSLEQDMAMVLGCKIHLGSSSGPTALASFTNKPYVIFNTPNVPHIPKYQGAKTIDEKGDVRTSWATPFQKFTTHPETAEEIFSEFVRAYESYSTRG